MEISIRPEGPRLPNDFEPQQHSGLQAYAELLTRWNAKINLVGRQDIAKLWPRHIEDALFLYGCLPDIRSAPWLLDIGTGGGLPGMVLAIVDSERNYVLCDRSERKVRFLNQVIAELKLANVHTLCGDFSAPIENARSGVGQVIGQSVVKGVSAQAIPCQFKAICARAVAPPDSLWSSIQHLLAPEGELLVACGPQTRDQLPTNVDVEWWPDSEASGDRGVVQLKRCKG